MLHGKYSLLTVLLLPSPLQSDLYFTYIKMNKFCTFLFVAMVAAASAFAPPMQSSKLTAKTSVTAFVRVEQPSTTALKMAEDMSWEGEFPPSKVLGPIMSKMPSSVLGVLSLFLLATCAYSCGMSRELYSVPGAIADGSWVKWYYVLGSFMGPLAWGTHVACWIQRKNGM